MSKKKSSPQNRRGTKKSATIDPFVSMKVDHIDFGETGSTSTTFSATATAADAVASPVSIASMLVASSSSAASSSMSTAPPPATAAVTPAVNLIRFQIKTLTGKILPITLPETAVLDEVLNLIAAALRQGSGRNYRLNMAGRSLSLQEAHIQTLTECGIKNDTVLFGLTNHGGRGPSPADLIESITVVWNGMSFQPYLGKDKPHTCTHTCDRHLFVVCVFSSHVLFLFVNHEKTKINISQKERLPH